MQAACWGASFRAEEALIFGTAQDYMIAKGLRPITSDAIECLVRRLQQLEWHQKGFKKEVIASLSWSAAPPESLVPRDHRLMVTKLAQADEALISKERKATGGAGNARGGKATSKSGGSGRSGHRGKKQHDEKRAGGSSKTKPAGAHKQ